jgi:RecB family endonuclease NucS
MVNYLCDNKDVVAEAIGLDDIWIRGKEFPVRLGGLERADIVFQDKYDSKNEIDATLYVIELKSDEADHSIIGQLQKYVDEMSIRGKMNGHWSSVRGITVAPSYKESALRLLEKTDYIVLKWNDIVSVKLEKV